MSSPLLSPAELLPRLGEVTLLDVRYQQGRSDGHEQYLAGHLPGAVFVDLDADLAEPPSQPVDERGRHPLPDPARFAALLRRWGVRSDRPVVVYDNTAGVFAGRAWWLLRDAGHPDVRLLDGGLDAWRADGGTVETGEVMPEEGDFRSAPGRLPVVDADGAARLARDGVLVDARAAERFRGETEPLDPVAGHVPGAVNVPMADNLVEGPDGVRRFRTAAELRERYAAAGVRDGVEVGAYCGSGVTAAHDVFALHLIGVEAALFAPSWSGWVADPQRPVETVGCAAPTSARP
jgi:thiosulfate/3-mercaptopyruvate sulfurtransferase